MSEPLPKFADIKPTADRVEALHMQVMEAFSDAELIKALSYYRTVTSSGRHVPDHADVAMLHLLRAFQKFRACLPVHSGDSPFSY